MEVWCCIGCWRISKEFGMTQVEDYESEVVQEESGEGCIPGEDQRLDVRHGSSKLCVLY